jgi:two-component sensor histidine kinase
LRLPADPNATKHGAWSTRTGTMSLDWTRIDRAGRTTVKYDASGIVCELECPCL